MFDSKEELIVKIYIAWLYVVFYGLGSNLETSESKVARKFQWTEKIGHAEPIRIVLEPLSRVFRVFLHSIQL